MLCDVGPGMAGNMNTTIMNTMYAEATNAIGALCKRRQDQWFSNDGILGLTMSPRLKGPGTNFCPPTQRAMMGVTKPMYCETMDMVKTALIAKGPANDSSPRSSAMRARKITAWTGVFVRGLMLYNSPENGSPWSREKANSCRDPAMS